MNSVQVIIQFLAALMVTVCIEHLVTKMPMLSLILFFKEMPEVLILILNLFQTKTFVV